MLVSPLKSLDLATYKEKAKALARRFFPSLEANLNNIEDLDLLE